MGPAVRPYGRAVRALPAHRGSLIAVAGANTPAKGEFVAALTDAITARGAPALVIGNRSLPDPESDPGALALVDEDAADDAIMVNRLAESAAVLASGIVITVRPSVDEVARYRAATAMRSGYARQHAARRIERMAADTMVDYDVVLWARTASNGAASGAMDAAVGTLLGDLRVTHHAIDPPASPAEIAWLAGWLAPAARA